MKGGRTLKVISTILKELQTVCNDISDKEYRSLVSLLRKDCTFYFAGEGRTGLVAKVIAMRLMHAGKKVYVVGETITPAIEVDDVLILLSGSGKTNQVVYLGEKASKCGAHVFFITTNKQAIKQDWCKEALHIPAATKCRFPNESETIQPLGNQFDQSAHIILDAAIIDSLEETKQKMKDIHSNLE